MHTESVLQNQIKTPRNWELSTVIANKIENVEIKEETDLRNRTLHVDWKPERNFKVPNWHFGLHFGGDGRVASHQAKAQCNPKGIGRKNRKIGKNHQAPYGSIDRTGNYCETEW